MTKDSLQNRIEFLVKVARHKRYKPEDFPLGSNTRAVLEAIQQRDAEHFDRVVNGALSAPTIPGDKNA